MARGAEQLLIAVLIGAASPQRDDVIDNSAGRCAPHALACLAQAAVALLDVLAVLHAGAASLALNNWRLHAHDLEPRRRHLPDARLQPSQLHQLCRSAIGRGSADVRNGDPAIQNQHPSIVTQRLADTLDHLGALVDGEYVRHGQHQRIASSQL